MQFLTSKLFWLYLTFGLLLLIFGGGLLIVKLRFKKHYQKYHQK